MEPTTHAAVQALVLTAALAGELGHRVPVDGQLCHAVDDEHGFDEVWTAGVFNDDVIELFTAGWCWALAAVACIEHGYELWALGEEERQCWTHIVISDGSGWYADIHGAATGGELADAWDGLPWLLSADATAELARDSGSDTTQAIPAARVWVGHVVEALRTRSKTVDIVADGDRELVDA